MKTLRSLINWKDLFRYLNTNIMAYFICIHTKQLFIPHVSYLLNLSVRMILIMSSPCQTFSGECYQYSLTLMGFTPDLFIHLLCSNILKILQLWSMNREAWTICTFGSPELSMNECCQHSWILFSDHVIVWSNGDAACLEAIYGRPMVQHSLSHREAQLQMVPKPP